MEESVANVCLEVDELRHCDITPHQSVCKEIKNIAIKAEEITENPEYIVMLRSIAVQTVTNEEVVIPKQDSVLAQRSNPTAFSSEGGSTMEIDISSQESAMDIASQESLSAKELNSGESHYCGDSVSASLHGEALLESEEAVRNREKALQMKEESLRNREEALQVREESLRKREEAVLECQEKVRILEEGVANRKRVVLQLEMEVEEHQEMLNNRETRIAEQELILKKLEIAIKIRELEAEGYKVIPFSNKSCVPAKRARKN